MAKAIDREDNWARLGQQALKQGNHKVRPFSQAVQNTLPDSEPRRADRRDCVPAHEEL